MLVRIKNGANGFLVALFLTFNTSYYTQGGESFFLLEFRIGAQSLSQRTLSILQSCNEEKILECRLSGSRSFRLEAVGT